MGAVTIGKGSRDRTKNRKLFKERHGEIKWNREIGATATKVIKKPGKTRYVYT